MTLATALISGNDPLPQLAEMAVAQAMEKAGLERANGVLLFLTPEFARHAQSTITAVARCAQSTQVAGGIAAGVLTESGWVMDRPAAAVMVFGGALSLNPAESDVPHSTQPVLSYTGGHFPSDWHNTTARYGASFTGSVAYAEPVVWQQCRISEAQRCSVQLSGADLQLAVSCGLQLLGEAQVVEHSNGFDLHTIGGQSALNSLNRLLPLALREQEAPPLHPLCAVLINEDTGQSTVLGAQHAIALITINTDQSITLAEPVKPGQRLAWAIRQPLAAENDMRHSLDLLAQTLQPPHPAPAGALMFSCIGRGPYFYGGEDQDLKAMIERFPNLPLLGAYGTGQIVPLSNNSIHHNTNRHQQNTVISALICPHSPSLQPSPKRSAHVQSIT